MIQINELWRIWINCQNLPPPLVLTILPTCERGISLLCRAWSRWITLIAVRGDPLEVGHQAIATERCDSQLDGVDEWGGRYHPSRQLATWLAFNPSPLGSSKTQNQGRESARNLYYSVYQRFLLAFSQGTTLLSYWMWSSSLEEMLHIFYDESTFFQFCRLPSQRERFIFILDIHEWVTWFCISWQNKCYNKK